MLSSDLSAGLGECNVDFLGAIAFAPALGSASLRAGLSLDAGKLREAIERLAEYLLPRTGTPDVCGPIARLAIYERLCSHCRECGGNGMGTGETGVVIDCPVCTGSGVHRFSTMERRRIAGLDTWHARHDRLLGIAAAILSGEELTGLNVVAEQLERY